MYGNYLQVKTVNGKWKPLLTDVDFEKVKVGVSTYAWFRGRKVGLIHRDGVSKYLVLFVSGARLFMTSAQSILRLHKEVERQMKKLQASL